MKSIKIGDVFTPEQLEKAKELRVAKAIHDAITFPCLDQINERTGQANNPMYWAYALEYAVSEAERRSAGTMAVRGG